MNILIIFWIWFNWIYFAIVLSLQESSSSCRFLFRLLFRHETAVNANHIGRYDWRRRSHHTKYTVSDTAYRICFYFSCRHFLRLIRFKICPFGRFVQSWSVRNNGEEAWPYGCYIKCSSNESLPVVPVNPIEPGQCTVISVSLTSPSELGSYQTKWRLFTSNGSCFGGKTFIFAFLISFSVN